LFSYGAGGYKGILGRCCGFLFLIFGAAAGFGRVLAAKIAEGIFAAQRFIRAKIAGWTDSLWA